MNTPDPADAVRIAETDLRLLVRSVLEKKHGEQWLVESGISKERLEKIPSRIVEEGKRRKSVVTSRDELDYLEVADLATIIHKNWAEFKPILGDKKTIDTYLSKLIAYRTPTAHSRPLMPHEAQLLAGISGEIRNLVTIYRSTQDDAGEYYPRIESIVDAHGKNLVGSIRTAIGSLIVTELWITVGTKLAFTCAARDPQGRTLHWKLSSRLRVLDSASGEIVTLSASVTDEDVADYAAFEIEMTSEGKYHRHRTFDETATFTYGVKPPE